MTMPEPPIDFQLQHALAQLGQADNQCAECGVYRADGKPPLIHHTTCESSGTAENHRRMSTPPEMPPWVHMGYSDNDTGQWWRPTSYGPGYELEGDDS